MTWNHDITAAPLGTLVTSTRTVNEREHQISEYHVAPVWLALPDGSVCRSYWIPETKRGPGRWAGLSDKSPAPIAWQDFITPAHPGSSGPVSQPMHVDTGSVEFMSAVCGEGSY